LSRKIHMGTTKYSATGVVSVYLWWSIRYDLAPSFRSTTFGRTPWSTLAEQRPTHRPYRQGLPVLIKTQPGS